MADVNGEIVVRAAPSIRDGAPSSFAGTFVSGGGSTPPTVVNYIQRVYSSGLAAWCYYTETAIDAAPASGDTSPNWTGAITAHEVLGSYS